MVRPERRRALREAIEDLERYRDAYDLPAFLASRDAQRLVLHAMYVAVQGCLDEAQEVLREEGLPAADRYRDTFVTLGQAGVLDAALAAELADWASFRNVLAHFYPILDLRRVHAALGELAPLRSLLAWLEARGTGTQ